MKKINVDILILGDENGTIAAKLGSTKRLGEQYTIVTHHRPCSSPGDVTGFDLIIVDACDEEDALSIQRRKTDTLDICERLRWDTNALILLTSFIDDEEYAADAYNAGVDEFIAMPIMLPLLYAKLQAWLRWRVRHTINDVKSRKSV